MGYHRTFRSFLRPDISYGCAFFILFFGCCFFSFFAGVFLCAVSFGIYHKIMRKFVLLTDLNFDVIFKVLEKINNTIFDSKLIPLISLTHIQVSNQPSPKLCFLYGFIFFWLLQSQQMAKF